MRSDVKGSSLDMVLEGLGLIWNPGVEALKLQRELGVRSLEDVPAAAERAGYEICYADLPMNVSGLATVIAGKPHIVVNRAKSPQHRKYTIAHELGHHVLHVNPSHEANKLGLPTEGLAELQAHMFASTLVVRVAKDGEREDVLKHNPESFAMLFASLFMSAAIILIPLLVYLWSRIFHKQPAGSVERK